MIIEKDEDKQDSNSDEGDPLYQVELVFACNIYNEGIDDLDISEKQIKYDHSNILSYTECMSCGDSDCRICSECTEEI